MVLSRLHSHHRDCTATVAMVAQPPPVKFHIAPMQCYTNRHLRDLLGRLCPAAVLWTEMEKTTDLATEAARHRRLWHRQTERSVVLQLGGDDPAQLAAAVRHAAPYGYSELNLNCGCPSVEAGGADFGAALMRRPDATRRMLEEMAAAAGGVPVSLKCRVGTHDRPAGSAAPPTDEYEPLAEFVQAVSRSGAVRRRSLHPAVHPAVHRAVHSASTAHPQCSPQRIPQCILQCIFQRISTAHPQRIPSQVQHVAVHARAAVLTGLSPVHNRRVPPLRPELVARLALDFPQAAVEAATLWSRGLTTGSAGCNPRERRLGHR